jgi:hypothetical protein
MPDIQTDEDYREYQAAVKRSLEGLTAVSNGPIAGCSDCLEVPDCECCGAPFDVDRGNDPPEGWYDSANEPHISSNACDGCGCGLQGDRFPAHGRSTNDDAIVHLDICGDCIYYLEYARLDDTTMDRIGAA